MGEFRTNEVGLNMAAVASREVLWVSNSTGRKYCLSLQPSTAHSTLLVHLSAVTFVVVK